MYVASPLRVNLTDEMRADSLILTTNYAEKLDIDRAARLSHVSFGTGLKGDLYYGNSGKMDV